MTTEEIEKYLRTCGVQPNQKLIELCQAVYKDGYMEGYSICEQEWESGAQHL